MVTGLISLVVTTSDSKPVSNMRTWLFPTHDTTGLAVGIFDSII